jgi:hypothetical protein
MAMWRRLNLVVICFMTTRGRFPNRNSRTDVQVIGIPLTEISNAAYVDPASVSCSKTSFTSGCFVGAAGGGSRCV